MRCRRGKNYSSMSRYVLCEFLLLSFAQTLSLHRCCIHIIPKSLLSAMLQLLPFMSMKQSSDIDFMTLLVSAYPDLQPWFVRETSQSEHCGDFYGKYLGSLLHYDYGNDAAKRDEALVKVKQLQFTCIYCPLSQYCPLRRILCTLGCIICTYRNGV
jgi:hypothetical protein